MNLISGIIDFVGNLFGWMRGRQDLSNTPDMKANAGASRDAALADRAASEVKDAQDTTNLDQLRKDAAE